MKVVTVYNLIEQYKINGSLARRGMRELIEREMIRPIITSCKGSIYTGVNSDKKAEGGSGSGREKGEKGGKDKKKGGGGVKKQKGKKKDEEGDDGEAAEAGGGGEEAAAEAEPPVDEPAAPSDD